MIRLKSVLFLNEIRREEPEVKEAKLRKIVSTQTDGVIEGQTVDVSTATLVLQVLDALDDTDRGTLLSRGIGKIVTVSYKLAR